MSKNLEEQLGMTQSKANGILRKEIMFYLAKKCEMDSCYKCNQKIESIDDFTIEHKIPWRHKENAKELFFDMNNIAFSHHKCNISSVRTKSFVFSNNGYKGVVFHRTRNKPKKFQAYIGLNGKKKHIGWFLTAEEAAKAYDVAAKKYQNERAVTNRDLGLL